MDTGNSKPKNITVEEYLKDYDTVTDLSKGDINVLCNEIQAETTNQELHINFMNIILNYAERFRTIPLQTQGNNDSEVVYIIFIEFRQEYLSDKIEANNNLLDKLTVVSPSNILFHIVDLTGNFIVESDKEFYKAINDYYGYTVIDIENLTFDDEDNEI